MKTFLNSVAQSLLQRYGNDMSHLIVVFPNKRASLFLNQELSQVAHAPLLAPQYKTINDLFQDLALTAEGKPLLVADPIHAVCRLYVVYREVMERLYSNPVESLDRFYGWGEVMLADFNDIDKQMVNARELFTYVEDWEKLHDLSFLNEEQSKVLKHYFSGFEQSNEVKENFLRLWKAMPEIYTRYRESLLADGMLYDGALSRYVVDHQQFGPEEGVHYAFVGFNILSPVQERMLFGIRSRVGREQVQFFWDFDPLMRHRKGLDALFFDACQYIQKYQDSFPNALPKGWTQGETSCQEITYIKCDTANAQVHYVPAWLQGKQPATSAVVLADESLLPQVMATLPDVDVNITMGYPINNTPVVGFIHALTELQLHGRRRKGGGFYQSYLDTVMRHPFFEHLREWPWQQEVPLTAAAMLEYLRQAVEAVLSQMPVQLLHASQQDASLPPSTLLYEEALFRTHHAIARIEDQGLEDCSLACRLLDSVMRTLSVPFHGEPLKGLQVMGVLETRSLDFADVVVLSAYDGVLPKASNVSSLVPYCLREPFGLSTEKQQVNVYAYNFFRMLRRAKSVTLMFPTSVSGMSQGEMSRFMRQLLAETALPVRDCHLDFRQSATAEARSLEYEERIPKSPEAMRLLFAMAQADKALSPSAINCYLNCSMQFYFKYIEHLKVEEDISESLAENQFGTIFHAAAEQYYSPEGGDIDKAVDYAFRTVVFDQNPDVKDYEGELTIARKVITNYLRRLVEMDAQLKPFKVLETEQRHTFTLRLNEGPHAGSPVSIGGTIDRVDLVQRHPLSGRPAVRIIDYKTGGNIEDKHLSKAELKSMVDNTITSRRHNLLQTYIYSLAYLKQHPAQEDLMPGLIYISKASNAKDYDARTILNKEPLDRFQTIAEPFEEMLNHFLSLHLFSEEEPFQRTSVKKHCDHCDYRLLCGKLIDPKKQ